MPSYTFRDRVTGELSEEFMSTSAHDAFVAEHPELEQVLGAPPVIDAHRMGRIKPSDGLRERMRDIGKAYKGNTIEIR